MGYEFCEDWESFQDVREAVIRDTTASGYIVLASASSAGGRHFWLALQGRGGERFVMLALIERNGKSCGYKPMDESVHPFYYDVPDTVFRHVVNEKAINQGSADWRLEVLSRKSARVED